MFGSPNEADLGTVVAGTGHGLWGDVFRIVARLRPSDDVCHCTEAPLGPFL